MHLKIGDRTVNLDAVATTDTINREHPVTRKTAKALRLTFTDSQIDPVLLFDDEADAFRAFMAGKPDLFTDILKAAPAPAKAAPKAEPVPAPSPAASPAK